MIRRREFITLIGGATVMWPVAAGAQQQAMCRLSDLSTAGLLMRAESLRFARTPTKPV